MPVVRDDKRVTFILKSWNYLANLSCVEYIPAVNDKHTLFLINFCTSVGMLFGPDDLLLSRVNN